jgi:hypothetical protein
VTASVATTPRPLPVNHSNIEHTMALSILVPSCDHDVYIKRLSSQDVAMCQRSSNQLNCLGCYRTDIWAMGIGMAN